MNANCTGGEMLEMSRELNSQIDLFSEYDEPIPALPAGQFDENLGDADQIPAEGSVVPPCSEQTEKPETVHRQDLKEHEEQPGTVTAGQGEQDQTDGTQEDQGEQKAEQPSAELEPTSEQDLEGQIDLFLYIKKIGLIPVGPSPDSMPDEDHNELEQPKTVPQMPVVCSVDAGGVSLHEEMKRFASKGLLPLLLADRTTGGSIIWATDAYGDSGSPRGREKVMTPELVMSDGFRLQSRAEKDAAAQADRTRTHAEVATPFQVVKLMNDCIDAEWFGREGVFNGRTLDGRQKIAFPEQDGKDWKAYMRSTRLEITCGEAPYLVTRYDAVTGGAAIPIEERTGLLDRKLWVAGEHARTRKSWVKLACTAYKSIYGYELQGDNLLAARINLLSSFGEYMHAFWEADPEDEEYVTVAKIISWNVWQMNGLTGMIPFGEEVVQTKLDSVSEKRGRKSCRKRLEGCPMSQECVIKIWTDHGRHVTYNSLHKKQDNGESQMEI